MKKINSKTLAGTVMLATLVVVLDYALKYSGLKIPFPPLPVLKFDFTGIPIALSLLLYGFVPAIFTSLVALAAILARSGDLTGASMKALAELSTVTGMALGLRYAPKYKRSVAIALGVSARCIFMFFATLALFPIWMTPFAVAFNIIQGSISTLGGYFIYEAVKKRISSHIRA